jgi:hypothetical protein
MDGRVLRSGLRLKKFGASVLSRYGLLGSKTPAAFDPADRQRPGRAKPILVAVGAQTMGRPAAFAIWVVPAGSDQPCLVTTRQVKS